MKDAEGRLVTTIPPAPKACAICGWLEANGHSANCPVARRIARELGIRQIGLDPLAQHTARSERDVLVPLENIAEGVGELLPLIGNGTLELLATAIRDELARRRHVFEAERDHWPEHVGHFTADPRCTLCAQPTKFITFPRNPEPILE